MAFAQASPPCPRVATKPVIPFSFDSTNSEENIHVPTESAPWAGFSWSYLVDQLLPAMQERATPNITKRSRLDCLEVIEFGDNNEAMRAAGRHLDVAIP